MYGTAPTGGGGQPEPGEAPTYTISIAGLKGLHPRMPTGSDDPIFRLYRQVRAEQAGFAVPDPSDKPGSRLDRMLADLHEENADRTAASHNLGDREDGGEQAVTSSARQSASLDELMGPKAGSDAGSDASAGDLMGQVRPCWSRLPDRSLVPVTLAVTLDAQGRLATPPRIIRPSTTPPDQRRLIAEARALTAIAACLPYQGRIDGPVVLRFGLSK